MKNFKFQAYGSEYIAHFVISKYTYGGGLYIGIELEDGESWGDLSTNLEFDLPENTIAVAQYNSSEINETILKDLELIETELGIVQQGYGTFKIITVNYDKLLEYGYVV